MSQSFKASLVATLAATLVGTFVWISGAGEMIWNGHGFAVTFALTLITNLAVREMWVRKPQT